MKCPCIVALICGLFFGCATGGNNSSKPRTPASSSDTLTSEELEQIKDEMKPVVSGGKLVIKLFGALAKCTQNTFAAPIGFRCDIRFKSERKVKLTSNDIVSIREQMKSIKSGGGADIELESREEATCTQNTFADPPGFKCGFAD